MSMTLREAYETFLDRGAPIFKGERRRPAGGMNASCWRKMCKDIRLWKDLAKANIIFEEVTRGQRGMDFEMFTTALAIVADRKRVSVNDMCGFVLHYAAMYAYGNGGGDDNSSVNSMGSGGSLSSMGSVGSMSSITSSRIRKGKKPRRRKRVGGMMKAPGAQHGSEEGKSSYGYPLPQHQASALGIQGLGHNNHGGHHSHSHNHGHKGIATTSILEETKGSSRGSSRSSPRVPSAQDQPTPAPLPAPAVSSFQIEASAQPKHSGKPSHRSFAKNSDAKGEYDRRMRNSLEALNSSLLRREETSQEDLDASGFSWEQKERFNVKVEGDPSTWGWAHDGYFLA